MKFETQKRNAPIATLIKNYIDKNSGKVSDSRNEIRRRFDYLDWKDQKKIILAFLDSCKSDRQWVYKKLYRNWDKSFETKVREIWETYHEPMCAWTVIRFFPSDYVLDNLDLFSGERDYYFICLRFAEDQSFVIDESRLRPVDYLSVLFHSGRKILDDKALDILFGIVHDICVGLQPNDIINNFGNRDIVTLSDSHSIKLAQYYLWESNAEAVSAFDLWDQRLHDAIGQSEEYHNVLSSNEDDRSVHGKLVALAKRYAYEALDERYKLPSDFQAFDDRCEKTSFYDCFDDENDFLPDTTSVPTDSIEELSCTSELDSPDLLEKIEKCYPNLRNLYDVFKTAHNQKVEEAECFDDDKQPF